MGSRDWEGWMWSQAEKLLDEAGRIRWSLLEAAARVRSDPLCAQHSWGPPVNVVETHDAIWVVAALPGVAAAEIEVRIEGAWLVLAGRRSLSEEWTKGRLHILEIPYGPFERRVKLPMGNEFHVGETTFSQGLLLIELRKA